jgi:hypothetical protein
MREAAGHSYSEYLTVEVDYGTIRSARIDGTVGAIAVEIESRVSKQVRGAVMDLLCHQYPRKLLVLLPVHMTSPQDTAAQCRNILARFLKADDFRVIVLRGTGDLPALADDAPEVRQALAELGWTQGPPGSAP